MGYVCTYLTENIRRINFATERIRNSDIIALTNQCPRITYLNLTGTLVTYEVVHRIVTAWRNTMAYLCLPHGIATHLELPSEDISNYINLENLSNLWMRHIVNSNDDPIAILQYRKSQRHDATKFTGHTTPFKDITETFPSSHHQYKPIRGPLPHRGRSLFNI